MMSNTPIKDTVTDYLKTILITLLVAFIISLVLVKMIEYSVYSDLLSHRVKNEEPDTASVELLIEKNKYLEIKQPENYKVNLRLGELYEMQKKLDDAEAEYKKAIAKTPFDEFKPQYRLALLYIQRNQFDKAEELVDNLEEEPNKFLIGYKADIYKQLADKYYNLGGYENAIEKYEKSLTYLKILKKRKEIKYIENSLASSYVYLAEDDLNKMRPDDAIKSLQLAIKIVNAPILRYKLAILLMNSDPLQAYEYINEVFKEEPDIINYEECSKFITELADKEALLGNDAQSALYLYKVKKLKEYFKTNILSVDDVQIVDTTGSIKLKRFSKKYIIKLEFRLKNTSKSNLDSLYLHVDFKDGNDIIDSYSQSIADKKNLLGIGFYSPIIFIKTEEHQKIQDKSPKTITADIYLSKSEKAHKLNVATFEIVEKIQPKPENKFLNWLTTTIQDLVSKLPAFMF